MYSVAAGKGNSAVQVFPVVKYLFKPVSKDTCETATDAYLVVHKRELAYRNDQYSETVISKVYANVHDNIVFMNLFHAAGLSLYPLKNGFPMFPGVQKETSGMNWVN